MAHVSIDSQPLKEKIWKLEGVLPEIQAKVQEVSKKSPSNLNWYDRWSMILEELLNQMKNLLNLAERCQQLLHSVESSDKTAPRAGPTVEILNDVMNYIQFLNADFIQYFGEDFDELVKIIKIWKITESDDQRNPLEESFSTEQLNSSRESISSGQSKSSKDTSVSSRQTRSSRASLLSDKLKASKKAQSEALIKFLSECLDIFDKNSKFREISLQIHRIRNRLIFIESEMKSTGETKSVALDQSPTGIAERELIKISDEKNVESFVKEYKTLNLGMSAIISELSEFNSRKSAQGTLRTYENRYAQIRKAKDGFRSTNPSITSWFDKWCRISNEANLMLTSLFELWDLVFNIREIIDGTTLTKIEFSSKNMFNQLMLNSNALNGMFESFIRKLWPVYGDKAKEIWLKIEELNDEPEHQEKKDAIKRVLDAMNMKNYKQHFSNVRGILEHLRNEVRMLKGRFEQIQATENHILTQEAYNDLIEKYSKIISEYGNKSFKEYVDFDLDYIFQTFNALHPSGSK